MMSKIKQYVLCIDGTEYLIKAQKNTASDGMPSIKIWFDYKDSEQSAELGYKTEKKRNKCWKKLDIKTVSFFIEMFNKGEVTLPKGETNE